MADGGRAAGVAFVIASALAFGTMAVLARRVYADGVDTTTLLALRFGIAFACLAPVAGVMRATLPRGRDLAVAAALGAIGYGGQAMTFFTALMLAPAGVVALLLYLHPALVAVLAALLLHERMDARKLVACGVALGGMVLTVAPAATGALGDVYPKLPLGIALGIAAAAIYSVYIIVGTRLGSRVEPLALATVVIGSAALVFAVAALARGPVLPRTLAGWAAITGIALVCTVGAITLYFAGLSRVGATRAATLSTIEPLFTVMLAAVVLDERIAAVQVAGGALILVAVVMLARQKRS